MYFQNFCFWIQNQVILNLSDKDNFRYNDLEKSLFDKNKTMSLNVKTKVDIKNSIKTNADVEISSKTNFGINNLLEKIYSCLSKIEPKETSVITSDRQILHSKKALNALRRIKKLSISEETELVAEELRLASKHISNITSLIDNEDILDRIFKNFCIGK